MARLIANASDGYPNVELLKRYRNGVCHFQRNYSDLRFLDLINGQGVVSWVRELNLAFGRYLLERLLGVLDRGELPSK
jgi:hypothetical protein